MRINESLSEHTYRFSNGWIRHAWVRNGDARTLDFRTREARRLMRLGLAGVTYTKTVPKFGPTLAHSARCSS